MYSKKVIEHFMHPHNVGEIPNADGIGKAGNVICGDVMWIFIKVKKEGNEHHIVDIRFKTLGCAAAIAASSQLTDMAKGLTIEEALSITNKKVAESLGGLPPVKMHCSVLAADALKEAIYDYMKRQNMPIPPELEKVHQRVQKELHATESAYGEFIKQQERALFGSHNAPS